MSTYFTDRCARGTITFMITITIASESVRLVRIAASANISLALLNRNSDIPSCHTIDANFSRHRRKPARELGF